MMEWYINSEYQVAQLFTLLYHRLWQIVKRENNPQYSMNWMFLWNVNWRLIEDHTGTV